MALVREDEALMAALDGFGAEMRAVNEAYDKQVEALQIPMRQELETILEERQPLLDSAEGFWVDRMRDRHGPIASLLNVSTDPKLLRAIKTFCVKSRVENNRILRRVDITLRPNVMIGNTHLFRELDPHRVTTACSGIEWRDGTEKLRENSLFKFFDTACEDKILLEGVLNAFDEVFQDPFNFEEMESDMGSDEGDEDEGDEDMEEGEEDEEDAE